MVKHYIDAANELMDLANKCPNDELAKILKSGSLKIVQLAHSHGAILKVAASEIPVEEKVETAETTE